VNLLDYLPSQAIESARRVVATNPIRVYAPEDPTNLSRLADASPAFCLAYYSANLRRPEMSDLHNFVALGEFIRGGSKLILPSEPVCRVMAQVDLNLTLADYGQPYESTGVVIPKAVTGLPKDILAISHWKPGLGVFVGTLIGDYLLYRTIGAHWAGTLEDHLAVIDHFEANSTIEHPHALATLISRIVTNACLFALERGVRLRRFDSQERSCRRRAVHDKRAAKLAARIGQEAVIQDLDLILPETGPCRTGEPTGRHLRLHRRRGHWKMQAFGSGRSERKRIFVASYLVNADGPDVAEITSVIS
jgi:hypothetical protein